MFSAVSLCVLVTREGLGRASVASEHRNFSNARTLSNAWGFVLGDYLRGALVLRVLRACRLSVRASIGLLGACLWVAGVPGVRAAKGREG